MPPFTDMEISSSGALLEAPRGQGSAAAFLWCVYGIEGLGSVGGNLLMYGIFFYMQRHFGWGASRNLPLSSAQGVFYVAGALGSSPLSRLIDRGGLLRFFQLGMVAIAVAGFFAASPVVIVPLLLGYTLLSAAQWPLLENLISLGASPRELSRRISIYNLVWSGTGALTVACCGWIIAHYEHGIFCVAAAVHVAALVLLGRVRPPAGSAPGDHLDPEAELIPLRALAKRLSRIALPATFAVIYAMGAIMPSLSVIRSASASHATMLAAVWMAARWVCFLFLGATVWWHTRPRALLIAAMVMLIAFLGVTLIPSAVSMILWQIALGFAMGLIYSASLYFGMVLSDGSTAQNAYHEALIGLGAILGPGCGALAAVLAPGTPHASIIAVATILWISVMAACGVSIGARR